MRDESRTEAEAARAAGILGRHEWIGGGAEVNVPTPLCSVCQGAVNGWVCGPCKRDAYQSPAWWCPRCKSPSWIGEPEDRCDDCGAEVAS